MKEKRKKKTKKNKGDGSYSERVTAKWYCYAFNLGFLQLTCKASLIFKSNLELNYFKRKKIIQVRACCSGV